MCCGSERNGPKWKREVVRDHKFDYVDIDEFYDPSCDARMEYLLIYVFVLKSFAVYIADLWSAVSLLSVGQMYADPAIPPQVSRWIFLASILVSYLLLGWDIFKAKRIIASRDISYTFTNIIASRYYSLKDYRYFCLFRRIQKSTKQVDNYAFFVFFTLKGWKRLLLTEAPRQVINIVTLIALAPKWVQMKEGTLTLHNAALGKSILQQIMTVTMAFSVAIFIISFGLVCVTALMYVPLLCHIQGNLKEYCCHKVDKRIAEILKKQARKRVQQNQEQQLLLRIADKRKNNLKKKSRDIVEMDTLPQPTLPNIELESPYSHYPAAHGYFYASGHCASIGSSDRIALMSSQAQQSDHYWSAYADGAATPYPASRGPLAPLSSYYHIP